MSNQLPYMPSTHAQNRKMPYAPRSDISSKLRVTNNTNTMSTHFTAGACVAQSTDIHQSRSLCGRRNLDRKVVPWWGTVRVDIGDWCRFGTKYESAANMAFRSIDIYRYSIYIDIYSEVIVLASAIVKYRERIEDVVHPENIRFNQAKR